jgi:hypothetical protein
MAYGRSSIGRATASKTVCCGFDSCRPCESTNVFLIAVNSGREAAASRAGSVGETTAGLAGRDYLRYPANAPAAALAPEHPNTRTPEHPRARSSFGRAPVLQTGGGRFEPGRVHGARHVRAPRRRSSAEERRPHKAEAGWFDTTRRHAPVAQVESAPDCGSGGREFKSPRGHLQGGAVGVLAGLISPRSWVQVPPLPRETGRPRPRPSRRLCRARRSRVRGRPSGVGLQQAYRLFAHLHLADLAGHRHGEAVDQVDVARDLVVAQAARAEGADGLGGQRGCTCP